MSLAQDHKEAWSISNSDHHATHLHLDDRVPNSRVLKATRVGTFLIPSYGNPLCSDRVPGKDDSEREGSTGPAEKKDPMRVWQEMKQNGFLSPSPRDIPVPKKRIMKSKNGMPDRKVKFAKVEAEQIDRFTKIAAPSGLLCELNPGIIKRVRNCKQVHSILGDFVINNKLENINIQGKQGNHLKSDVDEYLSGSSQARSIISLDRSMHMNSEQEEGVGDSGQVTRQVECEDDNSEPKSLSSMTMESENARSVTNDGSENQEGDSSLPVQVATVAPRWLELLSHDIQGRLEALRRSRVRVNNVIRIELPFLISKEFSHNEENDQISAARCPNAVTLDMHQSKWITLFHQMDKALCDDMNHLKTWLNQVKEMQLQCGQGLKCASWRARHELQQPGISDSDIRSENADNPASKLTIRAAGNF